MDKIVNENETNEKKVEIFYASQSTSLGFIIISEKTNYYSFIKELLPSIILYELKNVGLIIFLDSHNNKIITSTSSFDYIKTDILMPRNSNIFFIIYTKEMEKESRYNEKSQLSEYQNLLINLTGSSFESKIINSQSSGGLLDLTEKNRSSVFNHNEVSKSNNDKIFMKSINQVLSKIDNSIYFSCIQSNSSSEVSSSIGFQSITSNTRKHKLHWNQSFIHIIKGSECFDENRRSLKCKCKNYLLGPKKCKSCKVPLCNECIIKSTHCPNKNCKSEKLEVKDLKDTEDLRIVLSNITVSCKCNSEIILFDYIEHLNKCQGNNLNYNLFNNIIYIIYII